MKFLHKYGTRSNEIRRAKKELYFRLTLVLAVIIFFVLMVLISSFRPRLDEEEAVTIKERSPGIRTDNSPERILAQAKVMELMSAYESATTDAPADLETLKLLEQAIEKQRAVIRFRGSNIASKEDTSRLEELLAIYDEEMGRFLVAQSTRLEEAAESEFARKNYPEAVNLLKRALKLQENINELHPRSSARNPARLHQLMNQTLAWETQPLADRADQLRDEAFALAAAGEYQKAKASIQAALEQQEIINQDYRKSRLASLSRLKQFQADSQYILMAEDVDKVSSLVEATRAALESNNQTEALSSAEAAIVLQKRLVARFPAAKEQAEILEEVERLRDSAASFSIYQRIVSSREATREALLRRDMDTSKSLVADWLRETRNFIRQFPNSEFLAEINEDEVNYLHDRIEEIPSIVEMVYSDLVPVPGQAGIHLFNSEVHQALYTSVADDNPSNRKNPRNPVDSLTWMEAMAFTERLQWILARPVSLPTREIYLSALGHMERSEINRMAWTSQNTNRETQPVKTLEANDLGFYDLLGNVSEWLAAESTEVPERVVAIGGAVRDSTARLTRIPEESRQPSERNRFVGFRFVVEMEPAK